ncbi:MAG TPA: immunoglobulin domain-containing protein [Verrucomicrobiae bacterium]
MKTGGVAAALLAVTLFGANHASAQNTNAYDVAANYTSFSGNKGFGFGAWVISTPGGGTYISSDAGAHPHSFGLWNNTIGDISTANRTFNTPLAVGATFSCDYLLNTLTSSSQTNAVALRDANGNIVFSFFHIGGDNPDGWYTDANGLGVATGFSYNYQNFTHLRFVLNSATSYTFYDDTTTNSFSGVLSGAPITQVTFIRGNAATTAPSNGQDFKFDTLLITSPAGTPPSIATQPVNSMGFVGGTVTLGTVASSSQTINYQWYFNNAALAGANSANLVLNNVGLTNYGNYFLIASNTLGSATSSVVVVTVLPFGYTNAFDMAANYSSFNGNQGFGFGPWALSTIGGGSYIAGGLPTLFAIWNGSGPGQSTAIRTLNTPMAVGGTFLMQLKVNTLDTANNQNAIQLQDTNGNTFFTYWHQGGDTTDGHFTDANGTGTATGFATDAGQLDNFAFVLNTATTYTFYDLTTGSNFSGTLANGASISQVTFLRTNLVAGPFSNGQDFWFNNLVVMAPTGIAPLFTLQPAYSGGLPGSTISLNGAAASSQAVSYQWYFGGTQIPGATSTNLTLTNISVSNSGNYSLVASNIFGASTSIVATVTVYLENDRIFAYEGFDYTGGFSLIDGVSQNGGLGWSGAWQNIGGQNNFIQDNSMVGGTNVPPGYDALSTGNSYYNFSNGRIGRWLDCTTNGAFAKRGYLDANGNIGAAGKTIYVSFLQQPQVPNAFYEFEFHRGNLDDPGRIAGVGNDTATNDVYFRTPNGQFQDLGVGDSTAGPTGNLVVDFYIVRIDFQPGHADNVTVYRNPTSLTEPATATVTLTNVGNMSFNGISLGAFDGNYLGVDEIRIGASWSDALGMVKANNMLAPSPQAGGFNVSFTGNPAFTYRVQRASSLTDTWTDVGTATPQENGVGTVNDPNASSSQMFYRTVTP